MKSSDTETITSVVVVGVVVVVGAVGGTTLSMLEAEGGATGRPASD